MPAGKSIQTACIWITLFHGFGGQYFTADGKLALDSEASVKALRFMAEDLGKPLTKVRDPFGEYPSFGEHNNARMRAFLDTPGFRYEFFSSTQCYASGLFDPTLRLILERVGQ